MSDRMEEERRRLKRLSDDRPEDDKPEPKPAAPEGLPSPLVSWASTDPRDREWMQREDDRITYLDERDQW